MLVQSGDKVPADLCLLSVKNLRLEEAALTVESTPVEKNIAAVDGQAVLGERYCMAYSSTLVVYGQGTGVVVATADNTEIGRVSAGTHHRLWRIAVCRGRAGEGSDTENHKAVISTGVAAVE